MPEKTPAYICLAGPTASGKTSVALEMAKRWPLEIVSVDSALVYRGLDIGTAKPTRKERVKVPHHLIDIREPDNPYSAADFARDASQLIDEIRGRNRIPLLVGGTMLYYKALINGLDDLPAATPAIRQALEQEAAQVGWPAMHQKLVELDPVTAQRLKPNDSQRIQRALEVYQVSGKPISSFYTDKTNIAFPPMLSLEPENRAWLHERIAVRFKEMLEHGFLDEVLGLMKREPQIHKELPAIRSVGYRQAWDAIEKMQQGELTEKQMKDDVFEKGVAATRQLAKRQLTWLRSMPERHVVYGDDSNAVNKALDWFDGLLNNSFKANR